MNRFFVVVIVFVLGFTVFMQKIQAQAGSINNTLTLITIPDYPKPLGNLNIKAQSFSTDLDSADFSWVVNGKIYKKGTGAKEVDVTMGKPGTLTVVSVVIKTRNGQTMTQTFSYRPADVTLIWEADTYKPAFYRGHTTPAFGSTFRITAIPEFFDRKGNRMNPKDLVYTWKKNYEVVSDVSGYGKDSFITTKTGYLVEDEIISVDVSSPRESITGNTSVTITPQTPQVLFYENRPAEGIQFNQEIQGSIGADNDVEIFAVPFGISKTPNINFNWSIDGTSISDFFNKRDIVVDNRLNNMVIVAEAKNSTKLLQTGQGSFVASFKAE